MSDIIDFTKANKEGVLGAAVAPIAAGPISVANLRNQPAAAPGCHADAIAP